MNPSIGLLTERLRLREYESPAEAAEAWARLNWSPMGGLAAPSTEAPAVAIAFWDRLTGARSKAPRTRFELAVILPATGALIGGVRIDVIDAARSQGDIGYALYPGFWSQGYGTEAASELIRFGFEDLGLNRIWATCDVTNAASIRVLEKSGMCCHRTLPRGGPSRKGQQASYLFGLAVEDFRRRSLSHPCGVAASP